MQQKFITKCVRFYVTECESFIAKCDSYCKMRRFYPKIRQLLKNAKFITKCYLLFSRKERARVTNTQLK